MGADRPGWGHRTVLHLEPKNAAETVGSVFALLLTGAVAVAAALYRTDRWPERWRPSPDLPARLPGIVALVAGGLAVLSLVGVVVYGRRWRTARLVERLSNDPRVAALTPAAAPAATETTTPRATSIPSLEVDVVRPGRLPKVKPAVRQVTADRNLVGDPPLRIAYLRLFDNQPRIRTFLQGGWREFGYVALLRSATSVSPAEYRVARRAGDLGRLFIDSRARLDAKLARASRRPLPKGRHQLRSVAPRPVRVRDPYGAYPVLGVRCHGTFWKEALDELLRRVDLVVLDLSGFTERNAGTAYELQRVVDRVPIGRVVFLADDRSDLRFLAEQIQAAWRAMAAGSPNEGHAPARAAVAVTDHLVSSHEHGAGNTTTTQVRLVARRRESRRLAAWACARAARTAGTVGTVGTVGTEASEATGATVRTGGATVTTASTWRATRSGAAGR